MVAEKENRKGANRLLLLRLVEARMIVSATVCVCVRAHACACARVCRQRGRCVSVCVSRWVWVSRLKAEEGGEVGCAQV